MVDPHDAVPWEASPGNHALGSNNKWLQTSGCDTSAEHCANVGTAHDVNPTTGKPYEPNRVLRGDYTRVLAEFWYSSKPPLV